MSPVRHSLASSVSRNYLILFLGADWWGSDARALAVGFRQLGHAVIEINYEDFIPSQWSSLPLRILRRALGPLLAREYNRTILRHLNNRAIDFLLVFKGKFLQPGTVKRFSASGLPAYCFYPDVSFLDHGRDIWDCLPLYDCVFTTKSFHQADAALRGRLKDLRLVSHGFDPDVHRTIHLSGKTQAAYECDVSFVGCWSLKKEQTLRALLERCAGIDLRVWGPGWARAGALVRERWQGRGAYGDELAAIYCLSRINLALLSEAGGGTPVGDQVTARTWQIPAAGGFMLHEHTAELERYFAPGSETGVFNSPGDLAEKARWFLDHREERLKVAAAGHRRCLDGGYTYLPAAREILTVHEELLKAPVLERCRTCG